LRDAAGNQTAAAFSCERTGLPCQLETHGREPSPDLRRGSRLADALRVFLGIAGFAACGAILLGALYAVKLVGE